jgi:DNA-binding transcriptional regulator YhcF (GntR family)
MPRSAIVKPLSQHEKACAYLHCVLQSGSVDPTRRLVSCRQLAKFAGVSAASMWRALDSLRGQGLVRGSRRTGLRLGPEPPASPEPMTVTADIAADSVLASHQLPRQRLKIAILNDWLSGKYPHGSPLPSLKQMRMRYNTSFQTLKKVLENLAHEGVVAEPFRRTGTGV